MSPLGHLALLERVKTGGAAALGTVQDDMGGTFGALLLGTYCSLILYGLTVHQTYRYYICSFHPDGWHIKLTVFVIFAADTLYSILCMHICYHYLVNSHHLPSALLDGVWSFYLLTPVVVVIISTAQIFYARRIYLVGSPFMRKTLILVGTCFMGGVGFGIATSVATFMHPRLQDWPQLTWLSSTAFGFSFATDVLLTALMLAFLIRSRTGFESTETLLCTLMMYTINTGMLTSILCLLSLVFALTRPHDMVFIALNMSTTHSYATSVLAVINSRQTLKTIANATHTLHMSPLDRVDPHSVSLSFASIAVSTKSADSEASGPN